MKQLPYELSREAHSDIEKIFSYTAENWSRERADRYFNLIIDEIGYICQNTTAGKPMDHIKKSYRASKVKSHLIFYRIVSNTVEIIRILHERMDLENTLNTTIL